MCTVTLKRKGLPMKTGAIMLPAYLALVFCACSLGSLDPRKGTVKDYTISFFAAREDYIPCSSFSQSQDIYFVIRINNISDEIIYENAAFPTPLNIKVFSADVEDVFEHISSEQVPENMHIYPNQTIYYSRQWSTYNGLLITSNLPIPKGTYTASLLYWAHGDSAVTCTLTVR